MKYDNILDSVGNTPHIRVSHIFPENRVWIKDERRNPAGSMKDRIAIAMVEDAEIRGVLKKGGVIVEPTSGNTGIGLAMVGAVKGYRVILVMPDTMSKERRMVLRAYGAEIELTPGSDGMAGAISKANEIAVSIDGVWIPGQFDNPVNPAIHSATTAREILNDFREGIDYLVVGVGTAGHISGLGSELKKAWPGMKVIAVEPLESPVLGGGKRGAHKIQGIGAGFIPKNYFGGLVDEIVSVDSEEAFAKARELALKEGILAGISTGANIAALSHIVPYVSPEAVIMTLAYDIGDRYLSCEGLFNG